MAVPKRKVSKAKGRSRRTHWTLKAVNAVECPQCHEPKMPHRICSNCGYYKGRQVVEVKKAE